MYIQYTNKLLLKAYIMTRLNTLPLYCMKNFVLYFITSDSLPINVTMTVLSEIHAVTLTKFVDWLAS